MIIPPHRNFPIVDAAGIASVDGMQQWIEAITNLVNLLEILEGSGSPENVVFAAPKKIYYNNTGSAGTLLYVKTTAENLNTGWVAIG